MNDRFSARLSPDILKIEPYKPGKPIEELKRERGLEKIIKLASNENPLGPSPLAVKAFESLSGKLNRYPDGYGFLLKEALSGMLGVAPSMLALGNGSSEIIEMMVRIFVRPGSKIVLASPSFSIYELTAVAQGGEAVNVPLKDHAADLNEVARSVTSDTALVILGNPNNPTGRVIGKQDWEAFLDALPPDLPVLLDEAYIEYADPGTFPEGVEYIKGGRPVVVARTFSKAYGLAALRLGYAIAPEEIIDSMNRLRLPFNANQAAQAAALAALLDGEYLEKVLTINRRGRDTLQDFFKSMDIEYIPSQANYVTANVGDGDRLFELMLDKGIIIRSMRGFKMPEWVRITVGTEEEMAVFEAAFRAVFPKMSGKAAG